MKNYELIEELMKLPAGYDVKFGRTVQKDEMKGKDMIFAGGSIEDIQVSDGERMIEFLCYSDI